MTLGVRVDERNTPLGNRAGLIDRHLDDAALKAGETEAKLGDARAKAIARAHVMNDAAVAGRFACSRIVEVDCHRRSGRAKRANVI